MKIGRRQKYFQFLFFVSTLLSTALSFAGPGRTTYQAKIVKPDGYPLEASSVNFKFTILDPSATCVLYSETYSNVNMSSTSGLISFSLGSGVKTFPVSSTTFEQVFSNITPFLACDSGGPANYSPTASDMRRIVMQFNDGNGWQTLPAMSINAVPYAMYADDAMKFNGMQVSDFVQVATIPSCGASEALRYNGSSFNCVAAGGSGAVTSGAVVTAFGYTPADGASVTAVSVTVTNLNNTVTSLANSVATSFAAMTSSQWSTSGTNIFYEGSKVGIGTSNPIDTLQVESSGTTVLGVNSTGSGTSARALIAFDRAGLQQWDMGVNTNQAGNNDFHFRRTPSANYLMTLSSSGSVGIGVMTPVTKLDVAGGLRISMESASCAVSYAGTLRYNSGTVEYCNGTMWAAFGVAGAGILAINGLTSGSQTFAFGSAGTTPSVSSVGTVHTFNFPYASATTTTAGLISYSDYLNFNNKLNATSSSVISALTYTPANQTTVGASFSAVTTSITNLSTSVGAIISSQWTTSGTAIHYTSGNVGIGTTNPDQRLTVSGTIHVTNAGNILVDSGYIGQASNKAIQFGTDTQFIGVNGAFAKFNTGASANSFVLDSNNNVVMGTTAATTAYTTAKTFHIHQYSGSDAGLTNASVMHFTNAATGSNSTDGLYIGRAFDSSNGNQVANIFETRENEPIALRTDNQTRMVITGGGNVGIGTTTPSAKLHIAAGTSVTASLKITSGTLLTAAQDGAIEYDGTNLYYTDSANTRRALASTGVGQTFSGTNTFNGVMNISNNTASTDSSTGALIVSGGVGIGGTLNVSGSITTTSNIQGVSVTATSGMISPYIAGSVVSAGTLTLDSTTHSLKGNILLAPNGGNLGIGTTNPGARFHIATPVSGSANTRVVFGNSNSDLLDVTGLSGDVYLDHAVGARYTATSATTLTRAVTFKIDGPPNVASSPLTVNELLALWIPSGNVSFGGNLGVGVTSPTAALVVSKSTTAGSQIQVNNSSVNGYITVPSSGEGIILSSSRYNGSNWVTDSTGAAAVTVSDGAIQMFTNSSLTPGTSHSYTERLRVDNTGNIGIGTASPKEVLDVRGNISTVGGFMQNLYFNGAWNATVTGYGSYWSFDKTTGMQYFWNTAASATADTVQTLSARMVIDKNGNVGINTSSPNAKLHVKGNINSELDSTGGILGQVSVSGRNTAAATPYYTQWSIYNMKEYGPMTGLGFYEYYDANNNGILCDAGDTCASRVTFAAGGNVGIGIQNPTYLLQLVNDSAAKPGTNTWTIASDMRLKDSRGAFTRGMNELLGLDTIYFTYKKDNALGLPSDKEYVGIRAQDAQKVIPESVSVDEKGFLHFTSDAVFWTAVNAIKQLYHKLVNHDTKLEKHEREIASIKAENEMLKQQNAEKDQQLQNIRVYLCDKDPTAPICK